MSPFRLWILISAVGFTVMALMVSGVQNVRDADTIWIAFVLHFISLCVLL